MTLGMAQPITPAVNPQSGGGAHRANAVARRLGRAGAAALRRTVIAAWVVALSGLAACAPGEPATDAADGTADTAAATAAAPWPDRDFVRVAAFNIQELNAEKLFTRDEAGAGAHPQLRAAATIIQRVRPDVLVLNEVDHYTAQGVGGLSAYATRFAELYLETGEAPIDYPFVLLGPNNTGVLSGVDLNNDGIVATEAHEGTREHGDDAFGFGTYPGQYSMAVLSRFPMDGARSRSFRTFLWKDLPGNHIPPDFYSPEALEVMRLSSKSHMDLPIVIDDRVLHLWVSHPTPPVFDGDEDRNGRRNFDEIRLWALYLDGSDVLYDDQGRRGGFEGGSFVIAGDLNARPNDDEGVPYDGRTAISQLLDHPGITDPGDLVSAPGALQGHAPGPPDFHERSTAAFRPGFRIDYVLPSADLTLVGGGLFWPDPDQDPEGAALAAAASDHRMVWIDVVLP